MLAVVFMRASGKGRPPGGLVAFGNGGVQVLRSVAEGVADPGYINLQDPSSRHYRG